ncbi:SCO6880 family protein [Cellulomonas sp. McL0617]|uniref:SCO6880 family protein n=1 Tax=Cellulomonas sp. McL0617 TaxID=3415675 RepID=UPI003CF56C47
MSAPQVGPTTRFGRLESHSVLLGLSALQLVVVGVATLVAVLAVYSAGMTGLVLASPVWVPLLVVGGVQVGGRPVVEWLPLLAQWHTRRISGVTAHAASTRTVTDGESFTLPGVGGRLDLVGCAALGGVLVVDRRAGSVTGVAAVVGSGFVLDEPGVQEHKVATWGRALAGLCQQPGVLRVQVLVRTRPGGLAPARRWWREHTTGPREGLGGALASMLDEGFVTSHVRETLVAVSVRAPRRRVSAIDLAVVAKQLDAFATALASADLSVQGWLGRDELKMAIRAAYEPGPVARAEGGALTLQPACGVHERWRNVATGTAVHATYWVSAWPRSSVHAAFLQPLLLGAVDDRTVSVIAEPLAAGKALREIRRAMVEHTADAAQRARMGQIETETTRSQVADLQQREAELVAGHGDLRFTGLITVTAADETELEQRCAQLESAAAQAMCEVQRLVGQQGVAHAAACLPLARGVL